MIDVIVAGGGPAGLATAIFAADAGMRVAVVEPQTGPIDKACGEGIMPAGRVLLRKMGLDALPGQPFVGIRYHRNGTSAEGRFKSPGIGIPRIVLSKLLWQRASDLGVERIQGRVREARMFADHVSVGDLKARWLVAADGLYSTLRDSFGIGVMKDQPGRFGTRRHFRTDYNSEFVDVYLEDGCEAYVTPVGNGVVGVAILTEEPTKFEAILSSFPALMKRLNEPVGNIRSAGPFRRFAKRVTTGRAAFVGDSAGFLDPITGEGMRLGFESAELLVACMRCGSLEDYEDGWQKVVRTYRRVTSTVLALRKNRYTREAIVPVLKSTPFLFDRVVGLLGDARPDSNRVSMHLL